MTKYTVSATPIFWNGGPGREGPTVRVTVGSRNDRLRLEQVIGLVESRIGLLFAHHDLVRIKSELIEVAINANN